MECPVNIASVNRAQWLLKLAYGILFIAAGADKILKMNFVTTWVKYLSPEISKYIPLEAMTFLLIVGVIEVLIGIMILFRCSCCGGYLAAGMLLLIILNLLSMGRLYLDIAVRDLILMAGALALAWLSPCHCRSNVSFSHTK